MKKTPEKVLSERQVDDWRFKTKLFVEGELTNNEEKQYLVEQLKVQYREIYERTGINLAEKLENVDKQVKKWQALLSHFGLILLNQITQKNGIDEQVMDQQGLFRKAQQEFKEVEGPLVGKALAMLKEIWDASAALLQEMLKEEADKVAKQGAMDTGDEQEPQGKLQVLMETIHSSPSCSQVKSR